MQSVAKEVDVWNVQLSQLDPSLDKFEKMDEWTINVSVSRCLCTISGYTSTE